MNQWESAVEAGIFDPSTAIGGPPPFVGILIAIIGTVLMCYVLIWFSNPHSGWLWR